MSKTATATPTAATTPAKQPDAATAKPKTPREAPQLTAVSSDIPIPTNIRKGRGSKSPYNFDGLTAVGMSFGVKNKTASGLASVISNARKKFVEVVKDDAGNIVYKTTKTKDSNGNEIEVPTKDQMTRNTRDFLAADVDPKTDPDGASVRIWRIEPTND